MSDPRDANLSIRDALQKSAVMLTNECSELSVLLNRLEGVSRKGMITVNSRINDIRDEISLIERSVIDILSDEAQWLETDGPQFY